MRDDYYFVVERLPVAPVVLRRAPGFFLATIAVDIVAELVAEY